MAPPSESKDRRKALIGRNAVHKSDAMYDVMIDVECDVEGDVEGDVESEVTHR